jgi:predicted nucleotidyltransferase
MEILRVLYQKGKEKNISFILIGGHALNAYGLSRQTGDVDLVVRENYKEEWKNILTGLGYTVFNEHTAFVQFTPPDITEWPVDLILVDEETFTGLEKDARKEDIDGTTILIPSIEHMLALKLHALKENQPHRELKDIDDILGLAEQHQIDLEGTQFRQLCGQFASDKVFNRILGLWEKRKNDD